jgi:hypothetical protein
LRIAEIFKFGNRNAEFAHHGLSVALARFEPARLAVGTYDGKAARVEKIGYAGGKRSFRADKSEIDSLFLRKIGHLLDGFDVHTLGCAGYTGISMGDVDAANPRALAEFPGYGVVSATRADD